ncbi:MAG: metal-dependent hydrolase [Halorhabdus sp.]
MLPWGHAMVGYFVYSLGHRLRRARHPQCVPILVLVFGTQFPDLVDKPLSWTLGILAYGASLAHSAITFVLVMVGILVLTRPTTNECRLGGAFLVGYGTHIIGDVIDFAQSGAFDALRFLGWPLLSPPVPEENRGIATHLLTQDVSDPFFLFQVGLIGLGVLIYRADGYPCLTTVISREDD